MATALALTYAEMVSWLQLILNDLNQADSEPYEFPPAVLALALNISQNKAVQLLDKGLLPELEASDSSKALDSSGGYSLASLTAIVYNSPLGVESVRISSGKFCELISFDEYTDLVNINQTFSTDAPYAYFRGGKVHVEPNEGVSTSIDVYYRKEPTAIASGADCAFSIKIDEIIVHFAASLCYEWGKDMSRSDRERNIAMESIAKMNSDYLGEIGVTEQTDIDITE